MTGLDTNPRPRKKTGFKELLHLTHYLKGLYPKLILGLVLLIIVDAAQLFIPQLVKKAINGLAQGSITILSNAVIFILILALIILVFRFFWRAILAYAAMKTEERLRKHFFSHLTKLSTYFFTKEKTGDLLAHATNDILTVRRAIMPGLIILTDVIVLGGMAIFFMISISPYLTLISIIPLPILTLLILRFSKVIHKRFKAVQEGFSKLSARANDIFGGIRVVKAFVQENGETKRFARLSKNYLFRQIQLVKIWGLFFPLIMVVTNLSLFLVLLVGGRQTILGDINIGEFFAFQTYISILIWPMIAMGWLINLLQQGAASMGRVRRILTTKPYIQDKKDVKNIYIKEGEINIKDLSFSFKDKKVLKNINMNVKAGKITGIIGTIGSGKSILASLLPRIYEPPKNTIFIDGESIFSYPIKNLRKDISYVTQSTFLFSLTIKENLLLANQNATQKDIENVSRISGLYDEIIKFPEGFNTLIGERGITLSGGQKQRLALARALLKPSRILIMDDPLSAVDANKEHQIITNLRDFIRDQTVILISQRPATLSLAQYIYVFDDGQIVEHGTHRELINKDGLYNFFLTLHKR